MSVPFENFSVIISAWRYDWFKLHIRPSPAEQEGDSLCNQMVACRFIEQAIREKLEREKNPLDAKQQS